MPNSKKLIIDGAESSDIWHFVDDETPLAEAPAIISLTRLQTKAQNLLPPAKSWASFCARAKSRAKTYMH